MLKRHFRYTTIALVILSLVRIILALPCAGAAQAAGHPAAQHTAHPASQHTAHPAAQDTAHPAAQDTAHPAAQDTAQKTLPTAAPTAVGMAPAHLAYIDEIVEAEIAKKQLPGAVIVVGRHGKIAWRRAYGNRALEPQPEPMTVDTIFDLASLTKVVATATSVMILVERGRVRLGDPVSRYIPEFAEMGKKDITVEQLLMHRSGLIPDNDIKDYEQGPEEAMRN